MRHRTHCIYHLHHKVIYKDFAFTLLSDNLILFFDKIFDNVLLFLLSNRCVAMQD